MRILSFDPDRYPFHVIIRDLLAVPDLALAESDVEVQAGEDGFSIYKQMERSTLHQRLYDRLAGAEGERFYDAYNRFIREVVRPLYAEPILYQAKPTHRLHFRNGVGVSRFHKDADYGHTAAEVNYSVPQTPAFGTNTIWIESEPDKADYRPMEMGVGEFAEFKGATLRHGAKANETDRTRVSFDFRVIPRSEAPPQLVDTTRWDEEAHENPIFQNAHAFVPCP